MSTLFSIGYATKPLATFLQQLQDRQVQAVADVRSVPYSKRFHDYHREALAGRLRQAGMYYVYLGDELGPRSKDPAHYDGHGQVQFERLQRSPLFLAGIDRVLAGLAKGMRIALMCAEKDPAVCHRSLLVARYLRVERSIETHHILHAGDLESELQLEQRCMALHGMAPDLVTSEDDCLCRAWQAQNRRCAYRKPDGK